METVKLPKIDPKQIDEHNSGHTKDEWGLTQDEKIPDKITVIEAYKVIWNDKQKSSENKKV